MKGLALILNDERDIVTCTFVKMNIYIYICKTQIDVQSLIDVQSSNRRPILKYMAIFHFLKLTSTDVYFK